MLKEFRFGDIYIRHAASDCPNDGPYLMHLHEECEIYFFISGNVEYLVEGSRYPLEENSLMIMRPLEVHRPRILCPERYERYAINFPLRFPAALDPELRLVRAFTDRPLGMHNLLDGTCINTELVKELFAQMFREYSDEYDRELVVKTNILTLLGIINRAASQREQAEQRPRSTAERIVAYVNRHIFEPLTVPGLAARFYLSTSQLNRIFRQATGASPWEYITRKRLTAAKEKIHTGTPAHIAAEQCGFGEYSSFYRAYTKYFGCAPTENPNKGGV